MEALTPQPAPTEVKPRRAAVTVACMLSAFMVATDVTIVATAMPTIVGQLGRFDLFTWVFATYILTSAVTAPVYGRLADIYGRKRVYNAGASLYLVGSLLCGFAPSMGWLIVFRVIQGCGAGALQPLTLTILGDLYRADERARVQAWQSSVWGVAAFVGPVLGAVMVEHVVWSAVFWINIPLGVTTIIILTLVFDEKLVRREHRIDYLGSALLMAGTSLVLLAIVQAQDLPRTVFHASLWGGLVLLIALYFQEKRAPEPIVPIALWRARSIRATNLGAFFIGAVYSCTTLFLPTFVQGVMGASPTVVAVIYAAHSGVWSLGAVMAARTLASTNFRNTAAFGAAALFVGSVMLAMADRHPTAIWIGTAASIVGIGMGFCNTAFLVACQAEVGWGDRGSAVSQNIFLRTIGMAIGAGLGGAILNYGVTRLAPDAHEAVRVLLSPGARDRLQPETLANLSEAIGSALQDVYIVGAVLSAAALFFAWRIPAGLSPRSPPPQ
jgi:EmrB/QacA subfamily drug resistance transporter